MQASETLMVTVILVSGAGCAFLLVLAIARMRAEIVEATRIDEERRGRIASPAFRLLVTFSRPFGLFLRYFTLRAEQRFVQTGRKGPWLSLRDRAERNLIAAGSPHGLVGDEYFGLVFLCSLIGLAVGALGTASTGWTLMLAAGFICGSLWPLAWLQAQTQRRKTAIFRALPFALDLLTLSVEAGLDFTSALGRILKKIPDSPLGDEFGELLRQIQMGQARSEALRQLAHRVDLEAMTNVTGSLIQADELGASIGPVLRIQAEQMRVRREQMAEKKAMEAPVKILLPLILFIFPTVFLIILGPVALKLLLDYKLLS